MVTPGVYLIDNYWKYEVDLVGTVWFLPSYASNYAPKSFSVYNDAPDIAAKDFRPEFLIERYWEPQQGDGLW